jgi:hypothetical protein
VTSLEEPQRVVQNTSLGATVGIAEKRLDQRAQGLARACDAHVRDTRQDRKLRVRDQLEHLDRVAQRG